MTMRTLIYSITAMFFWAFSALAEERPPVKDSIRTFLLDEIIVTSGAKETNRLSELPGSISILPARAIRGLNIENLKDISTFLPNYFVPDYGSKMTSPVYIRGVGNRITSQASALYIDNVPIMNKAGYDFDFQSIQHIELLRGPQGTLFGRNSMGGLLNVFTVSPLNYRKTEFRVSAGNYGLLRATGETHQKINDKAGISLSAYYDHNNGYFTNVYSGQKADKLDAACGHLRFDYRFSEAFTASLTANYNFSDQGAFPYMKYDAETGVTDPVNYNEAGSYMRKTGLAALNLEYRDEEVLLTSTTSFQGLDDRMKMDQDYSPEDLYSINQKQSQRSFTEEITLKSNTSNNYRWLFGLFGFYDKFRTDMSVDWKNAGIQQNLDLATANAPVTLTVMDDLIPNPGLFDTPSYGAAIYHQSTINHLFTEGLSATAGLRLDYGGSNLDYRSSIAMNILVQPGPPAPIAQDTTLAGKQSIDYFQLLPKFALKYEFNDRHYAYLSATKGFNTGGYNIQLFAELIMQTLFSTTPIDLKQTVPFAPEYCWTYEAGYKGELLRDRLTAEVALFYIDIADMQLAQYTNYGRLLTNAGKAVSKGVDIQLNAKLFDGMSAGLNYGYTHATFSDYSNGRTDFKGHYLPFVPRQTFSLYATYLKNFRNKALDRFNFTAQYSGADKICWTESNNIEQKAYGLLNLKAGIGKGAVSLNLWTKNTLNTHYNTFYFEMQGNSFLQQGKPFTCGAELVVTF